MKMVDGVWRAEGDFSHDPGGRFVRADAQFRDWVTADGAPGPTGEGGSRPSRGATGSMCRSPVRGPTAR